MIAALKRFLRRAGRAPAAAHSVAPELSLEKDYEARLEAIIAGRTETAIVIVGANDGRINDPFYSTASRFADRTRVVLVEPQKHLHPILRENYAFHKNHILVEGAVGSDRTLKLFCIRREYWPVLQPEEYLINGFGCAEMAA